MNSLIISKKNIKNISKKLDQSPKSFTLNAALADAYRDICNFQEAKKYYLRALDISPGSAMVWNGLGIAEMNMGNYIESEKYFRKSLELQPNYFEAACNLGVSLYRVKRYDESIIIFRELVAKDLNIADPYYNFGSISYQVGDLNEAELYLRKALKYNSELVEAHWSLAHVLRFSQKIDESIAEYIKTTQLDKTDRRLGAWIYLGIMFYLKSDVNSSIICLENAKQILVVSGELVRNIKKYLPYMVNLLCWRQSVGGDYLSKFVLSNTIYVVGESHCLAAHDIVVQFRKKFAICKSVWIEGAKSFHFGKLEDNRYKKALRSVFKNLPPQSTVLLNFGEIDCRYNEGLLLYLRNHPECDMYSIIRATVSKYLNFVYEINSDGGHSVIVAGVPSSNIPKDVLVKEQFDLLCGLIKQFNTDLREASDRLGYGFLDVYAMTDSGDGCSNGKWHIDDVHLSPNGIIEAFQRYLTPYAEA